jgi:hypothetical protein
MDADVGVADAVWDCLQWDGRDVPEGDFCGWGGDHDACADGDVVCAKPCATKAETRDETGPVAG